MRAIMRHMITDGFLRNTVYALIPGFVILVVLVGTASQADAHVTGLSWTATTTPYVVDIGYDPNEFQAGQSARFDFVLRDEKTGDIAPYDHVWVRLMHDDTTLLATGVRRQSIGPTTLLYGLNEPGAYTMEASFRDAEGNDLAVTSFPMSVRDDASGHDLYIVAGIIFVVGLIVGALSHIIFISRKKLRA